jgi:hypothetical protein
MKTKLFLFVIGIVFLLASISAATNLLRLPMTNATGGGVPNNTFKTSAGAYFKVSSVYFIIR